MRTKPTLFALAAFLCASAASTQAQARVGSDAKLWIAASRTALSITGDIRLSNSRIQMAGTVVPLRAAGMLPGWRTFDGKFVTARLFEVTRPARLTLRNDNSFGCAEPVRWIVTWRSPDGRDLSLNTYTGRGEPRSGQPSSLRPDQAAELCGTYLYTRPTRRQAAHSRSRPRRSLD